MNAYSVHVVLDDSYGERLRALPSGEPVWIIGSAVNRAACEALWKERRPESHLDGYTAFNYDESATPEERFLSILGEVDLHHGEVSHDPPYSILRVVGARWTSEIEDALLEYGFRRQSEDANGFVAVEL
ncbi:MAG: hypothetical protein KJ060_02805 [Candidatus Hydrogenedentes bacterium]|nr:hypothetical protein [Candidatus Hydrogenedentota bacterium]